MSCKIKGCTGGHSSRGIFPRGFCNMHWLQFRKGEIDVLGRKITRRIARDPKQDAQQFNAIVNKSVTVAEKAKNVTEHIEAEKSLDNPVVKMPINEALGTKMSGVAESRAFIKSRAFVLQNIEFLHNHTLQRILKDEPANKKSIHRLHEAKIARMIMDGKSMDAILLKYGALYSKKQIGNVYEKLIEQKLIQKKEPIHEKATETHSDTVKGQNPSDA